MNLSKKYIKKNFDEYNSLYFNGILPSPIFSIENTYDYIGIFTYYKTTKKRKESYSISFSNYIDLNEEQFKNVLIHEMIHYYLVYTKIDLSFKHNANFKSIMNRLNSKYNLNIKVKPNLWTYKRKKDAPKFEWYLMRLLNLIF